MDEHPERERAVWVGDQVPAEYVALAHAVCTALLGGPSPLAGQLRAHLAVATISHVETTGAGAFVFFRLPPDVARVDPPDFSAGRAHLQVEGLERGAGCLVEVRDGLLDNLELYTYSEPWPDRIVLRDIEVLRLL